MADCVGRKDPLLPPIRENDNHRFQIPLWQRFKRLYLGVSHLFQTILSESNAIVKCRSCGNYHDRLDGRAHHLAFGTRNGVKQL
jgi:hypothetical protein